MLAALSVSPNPEQINCVNQHRYVKIATRFRQCADLYYIYISIYIKEEEKEEKKVISGM